MKKLVLASLVFLFGCGGGSDSSSFFFGGIWVGHVSKVENTCPFSASDAFDFVHTVNQRDFSDNTSLVILDDGTYSYDGHTDPTMPNEFIVLHSTNLSPGAKWFRNGGWGYFSVSGDSAQTVTGLLQFQRENSSGGIDKCQIGYTGSAVRTTSSIENLPNTTLASVVEDMGSATGNSPTPTPIPQNSCNSCNLQGCCSHHGGVSQCPSSGGVVCNDGSLSPTCTCH